jgi:hypothetical protein
MKAAHQKTGRNEWRPGLWRVGRRIGWHDPARQSAGSEILAIIIAKREFEGEQ